MVPDEECDRLTVDGVHVADVLLLVLADDAGRLSPSAAPLAQWLSLAGVLGVLLLGRGLVHPRDVGLGGLQLGDGIGYGAVSCVIALASRAGGDGEPRPLGA